VVENPANKNFISELTIVEWTSALARRYRAGDLTAEGVEANVLALMSDIATERVHVFAAGNQVYERAVHLLKYAGIQERRALDSQDAILLTTAIEISGSGREALTFHTSDRRFANVVSNLQLAQSYLSIAYTAAQFNRVPFMRRLRNALNKGFGTFMSTMRA
jgi:predicted nucleic acid-binding protein